MDYQQSVKDAAKSLNLLDGSGKLVPLDSLTVLDLVNEIERVTNVSVPTTELRPEAFGSIETVAELLKKVSARSTGAR
ncbi:MAG TPA: phosphopantetheine-binding protein [Kofleriaceae bacterium]|jgi:acyl carrier protein|nr:phosphopantetheine-binding protein [Kofleriaceae bacterium]